MSERPTIYVSSWSSHKTPGHHGPGRKYTIMARPRHWERGEGFVVVLVPDADDLQEVRAATITVEQYRQRYLEKRTGAVHLMEMSPGGMRSWQSLRTEPHSPPPGPFRRVEDGDTLCCACSRAKAAAGECHRVWAAELLREAGWSVVLDGEEI